MNEQEEFEFRARMEREKAPAATSVVSTPTPTSALDRAVGGWAGRMLLGAASPAIVAGQLFGGETIRGKLAELETMKQRGMAAEGKSGTDVYGLLGSLLPTTAVGSAIGKALPVATSLAGRMGIGAAQGMGAAAVQPSPGVTPEEYFPEKLKQIIIGGGTGGAVPAIGAGLSWLSGLAKKAVEPITESGRAAILARLQNESIGDNPAAKAAIIQALRAPDPIIPGYPPTAGEVLSDIPESTGLAAHQQTVSKMMGVSPAFQAREAEQAERIAGQLVPIARNQGALEGEKAIRDTITGPMRAKELAAANQAAQEMPPIRASLQENQDKLKAALLAQQALTQPAPSAASNALRSAVDIHAPGPSPIPLETQSSLLQKRLLPEQIQQYQSGIQQAKQALADLESQGLRELKIQPIVKSISSTLNDPEIGASDVADKSLTTIKDKLKLLASPTGTIDARALYMVRKEAGNTIKKFAEESKNFDQRMTAGLVNHVQDAIDRSIIHAGGKNWPQYLAKYQELSHGPEQMAAGQTLQNALISPLGTSQRGAVFANALRQVEPDVFTEGQTKAIQQVADVLARKDAFQRLAKETRIPGTDAIPGNIGIRLPPMLYKPSMVANFAMKLMGQKGEEKIAKLAAQQYLNPSMLATSLEGVPPRYQPMIQALIQQAPAAAGGMAARNF